MIIGRVSPAELGIVLLFIVLLFGVGRIAKIGGELGSSIRAFRDGLKGESSKEKEAGR